MLLAPLERLTEALTRLPSIGPKTARRLAYHLLDAPEGEISELLGALSELQAKVLRCTVCGNYTEQDTCAICRSERRDRTRLCVVAHPRDIATFERTGEYRGLYHVLGGLISPIDGIGPERLRLRELEARVQSGEFQEIVLATDPTVAGEATAMYLEDTLAEFPGELTRLAQGLPAGSGFEYTDEITLGRALSRRQRLSR